MQYEKTKIPTNHSDTFMERSHQGSRFLIGRSAATQSDSEEDAHWVIWVGTPEFVGMTAQLRYSRELLLKV
jgi:hypothetical protein